MVYVVDNSLKTHSHESRKNCRAARAKSSLTLRVKQHRREREIGARIDKSTKYCRCRNIWQEGRRNVWRGIDCRCRNSWPERRRNASGTTIRRPRTCKNPSRSTGPGRRGTTETAGNTRKSSIPVFIAPPWYPAALPAVRPHQNVQHDGLDLDTFKVRLQGAEGVTFGKQHTTTRTTESVSAIFAVSVQKGSLSAHDTRAP